MSWNKKHLLVKLSTHVVGICSLWRPGLYAAVNYGMLETFSILMGHRLSGPEQFDHISHLIPQENSLAFWVWVIGQETAPTLKSLPPSLNPPELL